jgi:2,5-furandicarboxylate decarboxylase 1
MSRIKDLRSFMEVMEENKQLARIKKEVTLNHEIGNVIRACENENTGAPYFENIEESSFTLIGAVLSSMDRIALAMECTKEEIIEKLMYALENPIDPVKVKDGPCHENVITGDDVNLDILPIPIHAPKDGGPFITGGVIVSKELNGTKQNLSFQRMQKKGKNKLGIMINEWRHLKEFYDAAESEGKALPISIVIGADPMIYMGGGLRYDGDELEVVGAIRGEPVEVVKSITNDIYVPATAEIVIEAEILPDIREKEGPLGEFTGHYSEPWLSPVLKVTAITHRNGAIYQTIAGAGMEHVNLGGVVPREPLVMKNCKYVSDGVKDVHLAPYGSGFLAYVKMKKSNPGEPKNVAMAAMISYVNIKNVIVVDEDIDIYNPADILWAMSNRVVPEKDIFYIPNSQGHELDPTSDSRGVQTKMGIDATLNEDSKGMERVVYDSVDLTQYL